MPSERLGSTGGGSGKVEKGKGAIRSPRTPTTGGTRPGSRSHTPGVGITTSHLWNPSSPSLSGGGSVKDVHSLEGGGHSERVGEREDDTTGVVGSGSGAVVGLPFPIRIPSSPLSPGRVGSYSRTTLFAEEPSSKKTSLPHSTTRSSGFSFSGVEGGGGVGGGMPGGPFSADKGDGEASSFSFFNGSFPGEENMLSIAPNFVSEQTATFTERGDGGKWCISATTTTAGETQINNNNSSSGGEHNDQNYLRSPRGVPRVPAGYTGTDRETSAAHSSTFSHAVGKQASSYSSEVEEGGNLKADSTGLSGGPRQTTDASGGGGFGSSGGGTSSASAGTSTGKDSSMVLQIPFHPPLPPFPHQIGMGKKGWETVGQEGDGAHNTISASGYLSPGQAVGLGMPQGTSTAKNVSTSPILLPTSTRRNKRGEGEEPAGEDEYNTTGGGGGGGERYLSGSSGSPSQNIEKSGGRRFSSSSSTLHGPLSALSALLKQPRRSLGGGYSSAQHWEGAGKANRHSPLLHRSHPHSHPTGLVELLLQQSNLSFVFSRGEEEAEGDDGSSSHSARRSSVSLTSRRRRSHPSLPPGASHKQLLLLQDGRGEGGVAEEGWSAWQDGATSLDGTVRDKEDGGMTSSSFLPLFPSTAATTLCPSAGTHPIHTREAKGRNAKDGKRKEEGGGRRGKNSYETQHFVPSSFSGKDHMSGGLVLGGGEKEMGTTSTPSYLKDNVPRPHILDLVFCDLQQLQSSFAEHVSVWSHAELLARFKRLVIRAVKEEEEEKMVLEEEGGIASHTGEPGNDRPSSSPFIEMEGGSTGGGVSSSSSSSKVGESDERGGSSEVAYPFPSSSVPSPKRKSTVSETLCGTGVGAGGGGGGGGGAGTGPSSTSTSTTTTGGGIDSERSSGTATRTGAGTPMSTHTLSPRDPVYETTLATGFLNGLDTIPVGVPARFLQKARAQLVWEYEKRVAFRMMWVQTSRYLQWRQSRSTEESGRSRRSGSVASNPLLLSAHDGCVSHSVPRVGPMGHAVGGEEEHSVGGGGPSHWRTAGSSKAAGAPPKPKGGDSMPLPEYLRVALHERLIVKEESYNFYSPEPPRYTYPWDVDLYDLLPLILQRERRLRDAQDFASALRESGGGGRSSGRGGGIAGSTRSPSGCSSRRGNSNKGDGHAGHHREGMDSAGMEEVEESGVGGGTTGQGRSGSRDSRGRGVSQERMDHDTMRKGEGLSGYPSAGAGGARAFTGGGRPLDMDKQEIPLPTFVYVVSRLLFRLHYARLFPTGIFNRELIDPHYFPEAEELDSLFFFRYFPRLKEEAVKLYEEQQRRMRELSMSSPPPIEPTDFISVHQLLRPPCRKDTALRDVPLPWLGLTEEEENRLLQPQLTDAMASDRRRYRELLQMASTKRFLLSKVSYWMSICRLVAFEFFEGVDASQRGVITWPEFTDALIEHAEVAHHRGKAEEAMQLTQTCASVFDHYRVDPMPAALQHLGYLAFAVEVRYSGAMVILKGPYDYAVCNGASGGSVEFKFTVRTTKEIVEDAEKGVIIKSHLEEKMKRNNKGGAVGAEVTDLSLTNDAYNAEVANRPWRNNTKVPGIFIRYMDGKRLNEEAASAISTQLQKEKNEGHSGRKAERQGQGSGGQQRQQQGGGGGRVGRDSTSSLVTIGAGGEESSGVCDERREGSSEGEGEEGGPKVWTKEDVASQVKRKQKQQQADRMKDKAGVSIPKKGDVEVQSALQLLDMLNGLPPILLLLCSDLVLRVYVMVPMLLAPPETAIFRTYETITCMDWCGSAAHLHDEFRHLLLCGTRGGSVMIINLRAAFKAVPRLREGRHGALGSLFTSTAVYTDLASITFQGYIHPYKAFEKSIHKSIVCSVDVSETGMFVSSSLDGEVYVGRLHFEVTTVSFTPSRRFHASDSGVRRALYGSLSQVIVVQTVENKIFVYGVANQRLHVELYDAQAPHFFPIISMIVVDQLDQLITADTSGFVKVWSLRRCASICCFYALCSTSSITGGMSRRGISGGGGDGDGGDGEDGGGSRGHGVGGNMLFSSSSSSSTSRRPHVLCINQRVIEKSIHLTLALAPLRNLAYDYRTHRLIATGLRNAALCTFVFGQGGSKAHMDHIRFMDVSFRYRWLVTMSCADCRLWTLGSGTMSLGIRANNADYNLLASERMSYMSNKHGRRGGGGGGGGGGSHGGGGVFSNVSEFLDSDRQKALEPIKRLPWRAEDVIRKIASTKMKARAGNRLPLHIPKGEIAVVREEAQHYKFDDNPLGVAAAAVARRRHLEHTRRRHGGGDGGVESESGHGTPSHRHHPGSDDPEGGIAELGGGGGGGAGAGTDGHHNASARDTNVKQSDILCGITGQQDRLLFYALSTGDIRVHRADSGRLVKTFITLPPTTAEILAAVLYYRHLYISYHGQDGVGGGGGFSGGSALSTPSPSPGSGVGRGAALLSWRKRGDGKAGGGGGRKGSTTGVEFVDDGGVQKDARAGGRIHQQHSSNVRQGFSFADRHATMSRSGSRGATAAGVVSVVATSSGGSKRSGHTRVGGGVGSEHQTWKHSLLRGLTNQQRAESITALLQRMLSDARDTSAMGGGGSGGGKGVSGSGGGSGAGMARGSFHMEAVNMMILDSSQELVVTYADGVLRYFPLIGNTLVAHKLVIPEFLVAKAVNFFNVSFFPGRRGMMSNSTAAALSPYFSNSPANSTTTLPGGTMDGGGGSSGLGDGEVGGGGGSTTSRRLLGGNLSTPSNISGSGEEVDILEALSRGGGGGGHISHTPRPLLVNYSSGKEEESGGGGGARGRSTSFSGRPTPPLCSSSSSPSLAKSTGGSAGCMSSIAPHASQSSSSNAPTSLVPQYMTKSQSATREHLEAMNHSIFEADAVSLVTVSTYLELLCIIQVTGAVSVVDMSGGGGGTAMEGIPTDENASAPVGVNSIHSFTIKEEPTAAAFMGAYPCLMIADRYSELHFYLVKGSATLALVEDFFKNLLRTRQLHQAKGWFNSGMKDGQAAPWNMGTATANSLRPPRGGDGGQGSRQNTVKGMREMGSTVGGSIAAGGHPNNNLTPWDTPVSGVDGGAGSSGGVGGGAEGVSIGSNATGKNTNISAPRVWSVRMSPEVGIPVSLHFDPRYSVVYVGTREGYINSFNVQKFILAADLSPLCISAAEVSLDMYLLALKKQQQDMNGGVVRNFLFLFFGLSTSDILRYIWRRDQRAAERQNLARLQQQQQSVQSFPDPNISAPDVLTPQRPKWKNSLLWVLENCEPLLRGNGPWMSSSHPLHPSNNNMHSGMRMETVGEGVSTAGAHALHKAQRLDHSLLGTSALPSSPTSPSSSKKAKYLLPSQWIGLDDLTLGDLLLAVTVMHDATRVKTLSAKTKHMKPPEPPTPQGGGGLSSPSSLSLSANIHSSSALSSSNQNKGQMSSLRPSSMEKEGGEDKNEKSPPLPSTSFSCSSSSGFTPFPSVHGERSSRKDHSACIQKNTAIDPSDPALQFLRARDNVTDEEAEELLLQEESVENMPLSLKREEIQQIRLWIMEALHASRTGSPPLVDPLKPTSGGWYVSRRLFLLQPTSTLASTLHVLPGGGSSCASLSRTVRPSLKSTSSPASTEYSGGGGGTGGVNNNNNSPSGEGRNPYSSAGHFFPSSSSSVFITQLHLTPTSHLSHRDSKVGDQVEGGGDGGGGETEGEWVGGGGGGGAAGNHTGISNNRTLGDGNGAGLMHRTYADGVERKRGGDREEMGVNGGEKEEEDGGEDGADVEDDDKEEHFIVSRWVEPVFQRHATFMSDCCPLTLLSPMAALERARRERCERERTMLLAKRGEKKRKKKAAGGRATTTTIAGSVSASSHNSNTSSVSSRSTSRDSSRSSSRSSSSLGSMNSGSSETAGFLRNPEREEKRHRLQSPTGLRMTGLHSTDNHTAKGTQKSQPNPHNTSHSDSLTSPSFALSSCSFSSCAHTSTTTAPPRKPFLIPHPPPSRGQDHALLTTHSISAASFPEGRAGAGGGCRHSSSTSYPHPEAARPSGGAGKEHDVDYHYPRRHHHRHPHPHPHHHRHRRRHFRSRDNDEDALEEGEEDSDDPTNARKGNWDEFVEGTIPRIQAAAASGVQQGSGSGGGSNVIAEMAQLLSADMGVTHILTRRNGFVFVGLEDGCVSIWTPFACARVAQVCSGASLPASIDRLNRSIKGQFAQLFELTTVQRQRLAFEADGALGRNAAEGEEKIKSKIKSMLVNHQLQKIKNEAVNEVAAMMSDQEGSGLEQEVGEEGSSGITNNPRSFQSPSHLRESRFFTNPEGKSVIHMVEHLRRTSSGPSSGHGGVGGSAGRGYCHDHRSRTAKWTPPHPATIIMEEQMEEVKNLMMLHSGYHSAKEMADRYIFTEDLFYLPLRMSELMKVEQLEPSWFYAAVDLACDRLLFDIFGGSEMEKEEKRRDSGRARRSSGDMDGGDGVSSSLPYGYSTRPGSHSSASTSSHNNNNNNNGNSGGGAAGGGERERRIGGRRRTIYDSLDAMTTSDLIAKGDLRLVVGKLHQVLEQPTTHAVDYINFTHDYLVSSSRKDELVDWWEMQSLVRKMCEVHWNNVSSGMDSGFTLYPRDAPLVYGMLSRMGLWGMQEAMGDRKESGKMKGSGGMNTAGGTSSGCHSGNPGGKGVGVMSPAGAAAATSSRHAASGGGPPLQKGVSTGGRADLISFSGRCVSSPAPLLHNNYSNHASGGTSGNNVIGYAGASNHLPSFNPSSNGGGGVGGGGGRNILTGVLHLPADDWVKFRGYQQRVGAGVVLENCEVSIAPSIVKPLEGGGGLSSSSFTGGRGGGGVHASSPSSVGLQSGGGGGWGGPSFTSPVFHSGNLGFPPFMSGRSTPSVLISSEHGKPSSPQMLSTFQKEGSTFLEKQLPPSREMPETEVEACVPPAPPLFAACPPPSSSSFFLTSPPLLSTLASSKGVGDVLPIEEEARRGTALSQTAAASSACTHSPSSPSSFISALHSLHQEKQQEEEEDEDEEEEEKTGRGRKEGGGGSAFARTVVKNNISLKAREEGEDILAVTSRGSISLLPGALRRSLVGLPDHLLSVSPRSSGGGGNREDEEKGKKKEKENSKGGSHQDGRGGKEEAFLSPSARGKAGQSSLPTYQEKSEVGSARRAGESSMLLPPPAASLLPRFSLLREEEGPIRMLAVERCKEEFNQHMLPPSGGGSNNNNSGRRPLESGVEQGNDDDDGGGGGLTIEEEEKLVSTLSTREAGWMESTIAAMNMCMTSRRNLASRNVGGTGSGNTSGHLSGGRSTNAALSTRESLPSDLSSRIALERRIASLGPKKNTRGELYERQLLSGGGEAPPSPSGISEHSTSTCADDESSRSSGDGGNHHHHHHHNRRRRVNGKKMRTTRGGDENFDYRRDKGLRRQKPLTSSSFSKTSAASSTTSSSRSSSSINSSTGSRAPGGGESSATRLLCPTAAGRGGRTSARTDSSSTSEDVERERVKERQKKKGKGAVTCVRVKENFLGEDDEDCRVEGDPLMSTMRAEAWLLTSTIPRAQPLLVACAEDNDELLVEEKEERRGKIHPMSILSSRSAGQPFPRRGSRGGSLLEDRMLPQLFSPRKGTDPPPPGRRESVMCSSSISGEEQGRGAINPVSDMEGGEEEEEKIQAEKRKGILKHHTIVRNDGDIFSLGESGQTEPLSFSAPLPCVAEVFSAALLSYSYRSTEKNQDENGIVLPSSANHEEEEKEENNQKVSKRFSSPSLPPPPPSSFLLSAALSRDSAASPPVERPDQLSITPPPSSTPRRTSMATTSEIEATAGRLRAFENPFSSALNGEVEKRGKILSVKPPVSPIIKKNLPAVPFGDGKREKKNKMTMPTAGTAGSTALTGSARMILQHKNHNNHDSAKVNQKTSFHLEHGGVFPSSPSSLVSPKSSSPLSAPKHSIPGGGEEEISRSTKPSSTTTPTIIIMAQPGTASTPTSSEPFHTSSSFSSSRLSSQLGEQVGLPASTTTTVEAATTTSPSSWSSCSPQPRMTVITRSTHSNNEEVHKEDDGNGGQPPLSVAEGGRGKRWRKESTEKALGLRSAALLRPQETKSKKKEVEGAKGMGIPGGLLPSSPPPHSPPSFHPPHASTTPPSPPHPKFSPLHIFYSTSVPISAPTAGKAKEGKQTPLPLPLPPSPPTRTATSAIISSSSFSMLSDFDDGLGNGGAEKGPNSHVNLGRDKNDEKAKVEDPRKEEEEEEGGVSGGSRSRSSSSVLRLPQGPPWTLSPHHADEEKVRSSSPSSPFLQGGGGAVAARTTALVAENKRAIVAQGVGADIRESGQPQHPPWWRDGDHFPPPSPPRAIRKDQLLLEPFVIQWELGQKKHIARLDRTGYQSPSQRHPSQPPLRLRSSPQGRDDGNDNDHHPHYSPNSNNNNHPNEEEGRRRNGGDPNKREVLTPTPGRSAASKFSPAPLPARRACTSDGLPSARAPLPGGGGRGARRTPPPSPLPMEGRLGGVRGNGAGATFSGNNNNNNNNNNASRGVGKHGRPPVVLSSTTTMIIRSTEVKKHMWSKAKRWGRWGSGVGGQPQPHSSSRGERRWNLENAEEGYDEEEMVKDDDEEEMEAREGGRTSRRRNAANREGRAQGVWGGRDAEGGGDTDGGHRMRRKNNIVVMNAPDSMAWREISFRRGKGTEGEEEEVEVEEGGRRRKGSQQDEYGTSGRRKRSDDRNGLEKGARRKVLGDGLQNGGEVSCSGVGAGFIRKKLVGDILPGVQEY